MTSSISRLKESTPGLGDTEFLFDVFIQNDIDCVQTNTLHPIRMPGALSEPRPDTCVQVSKHSLGAANYSGLQAIEALKEEGIYSVIANPNIATIATRNGLADKVYFLPVTPDFVRRIIKYEKPDGIYFTFGGQTALNIGIKLKDEFTSCGCGALGSPIGTVITTEDQQLLGAMAEIGKRCVDSATATTAGEVLCSQTHRFSSQCARSIRIGRPRFRLCYRISLHPSAFDVEFQLVSQEE